MTSQPSRPHMEKVPGTTRKRFMWYAFESSLMHLHAVRTCTAIDLAATWFLTRQSSITGKTWCGKTIWSRSLASSRLSDVTAPFNTSQECRDISNLFGLRLMLLCFILPHSQRGHLPISPYHANPLGSLFPARGFHKYSLNLMNLTEQPP